MANAKLTINDLPNELTSLADDDLLAVWDTSSISTAKITAVNVTASLVDPAVTVEATNRINADTALQDQIDLKAPLADPALTGVPTAPTAAPGTNDGTIANTAFVKAAVDAASGAVVSVNGEVGAVVLDAADVGLGSFAGYTPATLPLSTADVGALATKEPNITVGTTAQYWRGDKTFQPVSDLPVSTDQQMAIDAKVENAIVSGHTTIAPSGDVVSTALALKSAIDLSNVAAATRTGLTTVPYTGDIFNGGDANGRTNDLQKITFPAGARSVVNSGCIINVVDPGSGTFSGQGSAGAALVLQAQKLNYPSGSCTNGEIDTLMVALRQSNGDGDAYIANVTGYNGNLACFEGNTSSVTTSNVAIKTVGVQLGIVNSASGGESGATVIGALGTIGTGFLAQSYAGSSFTYPFVYSTDITPALWAVLTDGTMQGPSGAFSMGKVAYTPTVAPGSGTITAYTINSAYYTRIGNLILCYADVTVTTAGTGAGVLGISNPITSALSGFIGVGNGRTATGTTLACEVSANFCNATDYLNATIIASGSRAKVSWSYALN